MEAYIEASKPKIEKPKIEKPKLPKGRREQNCIRDIFSLFMTDKYFVKKFCSTCKKREGKTWVCMWYNLMKKEK
jgi:hypothetical protein